MSKKVRVDFRTWWEYFPRRDEGVRLHKGDAYEYYIEFETEKDYLLYLLKGLNDISRV